MAISPPAPLVQAQLLTVGVLSYYTVPTSKRTVINSATLHNSDTTNTIVATVYIVPSGGSDGDDTEVAVISLLPKETVTLSEIIGKPMGAGASIQALAATGGKVNLYVGGTEYAVT